MLIFNSLQNDIFKGKPLCKSEENDIIQTLHFVRKIDFTN